MFVEVERDEDEEDEEQQDQVRSLRFEKGLENVLFLVYK